VIMLSRHLIHLPSITTSFHFIFLASNFLIYRERKQEITILTRNRKLRDLEAEISSLRQQISVPPPEPGIGAVVALLELQQQQQQQQQNPSMNDDTRIYSHPFQQVCSPVSQTSGIQGDGSEFLPRISSQPLPFKPAENVHPHVGTKRRRGDFEINIEENLDVVNKGLISYTEAELYFETFFKGCVGFIYFIPSHSIRSITYL